MSSLKLNFIAMFFPVFLSNPAAATKLRNSTVFKRHRERQYISLSDTLCKSRDICNHKGSVKNLFDLKNPIGYS